MRKALSILLVFNLALASTWLVQEYKVNSQTIEKQQVNFKRHFEQLGVNGSILIYDLKGDRFSNPSRACSSILSSTRSNALSDASQNKKAITLRTEQSS